ncbi:uncharacterized protein DS421_16g534050 [Arachis hypogaea]|nr:uncharacterized protein DS421_16g534050 [Arachis hypogaea]
MLLDEDEDQFREDGVENVIKNYEKYVISSNNGYEQGIVKDDESHLPNARLNISKKDDQEIEEENSAGRMLDDDEVIGDEIGNGIVMEEEWESDGKQAMIVGDIGR